VFKSKSHTVHDPKRNITNQNAAIPPAMFAAAFANIQCQVTSVSRCREADFKTSYTT